MKSIQILRKQAELTQQELADKLGLNRSYVSKIENGVVPLNDAMLQMKLCEALGVPLSDVAPEKCEDKRFPVAVHGKLVYDMSEYYDALKENSRHCKGCEKALEQLVEPILKELQDAACWTYLIHLNASERKALKNAFQTGKDKEKWIQDWYQFNQYLAENWQSMAPQLVNGRLILEKRDWRTNSDLAIGEPREWDEYWEDKTRRGWTAIINQLKKNSKRRRNK